MQYDMKSLIDRFEDDIKSAQKKRENDIQKFKEQNPDEPLPEWFCGDFNLVAALKSMCEQIQFLIEANEK